MNLSEHFTLEEAVHSPTAERLGIANLALPDVVDNARVAAEGMEEVRALLGNYSINIDSWIRYEELERVIADKDFRAWCVKRGKPPVDSSWAEYLARKAHPKGYAVDFTCKGYGSPLEIVQVIAKSNIQFDQCIMEGSWVHVSFDPQMRRQVLTATFINGTPTYSKGVQS